MTVQLILEELENIAASVVGQSQTEFQKDRDSIGGSVIDRGLDSLDFVTYLMAVQEKYGFHVSDEDVEAQDLTMTSSMAEFIHKRLNTVSAG